MGLMSHRRRHVDILPEQKWDFINLNDFKSTSCFTPFAYGYLWFSILLSIAVYAVDTFTAINLLIFNRWSSSVELTQLISFTAAKWIFSICIILSFINLAYEHIRAMHIMKRGSVAESYLDNLDVHLESMRLGKGQGWRRFLVFAELTKSKKGAEYIALFTFFGFQSWIRVIVCSGPRQAVNALTLYSVYRAELSVDGKNLESSIVSFFDKIKALAEQDYQQALILSGMLFTLVIWVFSFLSLLLAALFFVFFLWHYIPKADGGLTGYCERKTNKRLMEIVSSKIDKAMADVERKRKKAELKAARKNGQSRPLSIQATVPDVGGEKLCEMPTLNRNDTTTTLPVYTSRPGSPGSFQMAEVEKHPLPVRPATGDLPSESSLVGAGAQFGVDRPLPPAPPLPPNDLSNHPPARIATSLSNDEFGPRLPPGRALTNGFSFGSYQASEALCSSEPAASFLENTRYPARARNDDFTSEALPSFPPRTASPCYQQTRSPVQSSNHRGCGPNRMSVSQWDDYLLYDDDGVEPANAAPTSKSYRGVSVAHASRGARPSLFAVRTDNQPVASSSATGQPYRTQRSMTAPPIQLRHERTFSNGPYRHIAHQPSMGVHTPGDDSLEEGDSLERFHQLHPVAQTPGIESWRDSPGPGGTSENEDHDFSNDYFDDARSNSQPKARQQPGFGSGWNEDTEKGQSSHYGLHY